MGRKRKKEDLGWDIKEPRGLSREEKKVIKDFFNNCRDLICSHNASDVIMSHQINDLKLHASIQEDGEVK